MNVSVIVVTWNGLHVLKECIAALAQQTLVHELIVVDNGSGDGTREWLAEHAPQAKVIALPSNLGFAGGNNVGMRAATGDYLVLLNNDTIAPPDFLEQLVAPLANDRRIGSVAGVLVFAHQPETIASAGIVVSSDGLHRDLWAFQPVVTLPAQPVEIFGASGGAVCYRRAALDDVGLFDERYFNYLEDADLAWRLRLRGWRCVLAPAARVRHIYSATSGQGSPFKQRLLARNRLRVILRCLPFKLLRKHWRSILRYDLLALGYGVARFQPAVISGRLQALGQILQLVQERRALQKRREVSSDSLEHWLAAPVSIREMLDEQRTLTAILGGV
ncbi:MAG: glycosyltransferase family 2 protein [Chloroflexi bacterium]|nr:glycosyltransferase family 2 protein [Chloroflexota bacterium]